MKQGELRQLESLIGTQAFLNTHTDQFGNINAAAERARLDEIITEVRAQVTVQQAGVRAARGVTEVRTQFEGELRTGHMMPIAEFAREKMKGLGDGEFKALTPATGKLRGERLVQAARGMAKAAQAHLPELEAGHFPPDVIEQLIASADAVQAPLDRRAAVAGERVGATKQIHARLAEGRSIVRTMGAVVKRTARTNPGLLAEWRSAQRVKNKPGVVDRPAVVVGTITPAAAAAPAVQVQEVKLAA